MLASVNGAVSEAAEARIPVVDEGLLRGDGAFEVARLYAGRPFAMEEHYARLERTCAGLRLPLEADRLRTEVDDLLAATGEVEALLRVVVTRGGHRIAIVEALPAQPPSARVATVTYAPSRVLDGLKTLSYAGNMLAQRFARERGADEALFVTPHGRVLEGTTWSLFYARDGELLTPPLEDHILDSITRGHVIEECGAHERPTTLEDLLAADEAFIASSLRAGLAISHVDDVALAQVGGPMTQAVQRALRERIEAAVA